MFIPIGPLAAIPIQRPAFKQAANDPLFCNLPSKA